MKNLSFITLVLTFIILTFSCSTDVDFYSGSGDLISETRHTGAFSKVSSEGIITVNITQGPTATVEIIADDNIIHRVTTKTSNNRLELSLKDGSYSNLSITANITMPNLTYLENSGSGNMFVTNMNTNDAITISNSGSGDITMSGSVNNMALESEGSGRFYGFEYITENAKVEIEGSGDCEVYATENLNVEIDGSANVYYKGSPTISSDISGSGHIMNEN